MATISTENNHGDIKMRLVKEILENTEVLSEAVINGFDTDDIEVEINNFDDLLQDGDDKLDNEKVVFDGTKYNVSYEDNEYYIREKRKDDNGDEYWKTLSPVDLKTTHRALMKHLESNYGKQKSKTTVDVYYKGNEVPYDSFTLDLADDDKVYVDYVNKPKDAPKLTAAAYVKLAEELQKRGFYLVSNKMQFSSGKRLWGDVVEMLKRYMRNEEN